MRLVGTLIVVIFGANPGCSQSQCGACWYPAQQPSNPQGPPRVGKAGPRGLPGQVGEPGIVNLTEMELMLNRKVDEVLGLLTVRSCRNFRPESAKSTNETGGTFDIFIRDIGRKEVYCDVRTDGGYWIVFQRRMDGSVDFYRDWNDYVTGFGRTNGEFWLGLEAIHQLTRSGIYEMRIDMIEKNGTHYYAKYSSFKVGPASDNYRLKANGYSGNATDSFANPTNPEARANNMPFSTRDRDQDTWSENCGDVYKGGWWYNSCYWSCLNGLYDARNNDRVRWYYQSSDTNLFMKFTEMKFRLKE